MTGPDLDVVVVGDGPAGLALAAACRQAGLRVAVAGEGRPWAATYGMWRDDVAGLPERCFGHVAETPVVHGRRRHLLDRPYAIVDNIELRGHLVIGLEVVARRVERVQHFRWGSRAITSGGTVDARFVLDASGRAPAPGVAGQSGYGVVVPDLPPRFGDASVTLMDVRPLPGAGPIPTFCYVVPVADGWLVEETVLAARSIVDPSLLRERLVARIGSELVDSARRVESVIIPMGGRLPSRHGAVVSFGAAAGYTHPVSGFSVAASLRAAPRVAAGLAAASAAGRPDPRAVWDGVWPRPARQTRRLHDYGLEVVLRFDANELAEFFDAFFDLPTAVWAPYLRIDARPREIIRAMIAVRRRLPRPMRRKLLVRPFWR